MGSPIHDSGKRSVHLSRSPCLPATCMGIIALAFLPACVFSPISPAWGDAGTEPYLKAPALQTRVASFENPSGLPGQGAQENQGAKGHAFERFKAGDTKSAAGRQEAGSVRLEEERKRGREARGNKSEPLASLPLFLSSSGWTAGSRLRGWWGEGEVKMYLDGDTKWPTIAGTGTEDYISTGWGQVGGWTAGSRLRGCSPSDTTAASFPTKIRAATASTVSTCRTSSTSTRIAG